jgi:hypothetical protein
MLLPYERSLQHGLVGAGLFRSRVSLEAEILILRRQLNIQRRHQPKRSAIGPVDRLIFVALYRLAPLTIVKPETVIRWHRAGFRSYWHWRSQHHCGRSCTIGNSPADPRDQRRQPVVGSAKKPWRASQARHRHRPDQRRQVHGAEEGPPLAGMEGVFEAKRVIVEYGVKDHIE